MKREGKRMEHEERREERDRTPKKREKMKMENRGMRMEKDKENTMASGHPKGGMPIGSYEGHLREYGTATEHHGSEIAHGTNTHGTNEGPTEADINRKRFGY